VLALVRTEIDERSIALSVSLAENAPRPSIDEKALEQVFLNILTNALEAMPNGGQLAVSTRHDPEMKEIVVQVRDSGKGIPENIRGKIFDPFFTTKDHGSGLGLSISYEIIKAHGGRISFNDYGEQQTICTVTLPLMQT
jgi:signal transduction histidine kinase